MQAPRSIAPSVVLAVVLAGAVFATGCNLDETDTASITAPRPEPQRALVPPTDRVLPAYSVLFLGAGYPTVVNEVGDAAGWSGSATGSQAWVSIGGAPAEPLPLPAGASYGKATDMNEAGVVVGCTWADATSPSRAAAWIPEGTGYRVEDLGEGVTWSCATAVNNVGDILGTAQFTGVLGARATLFTGPAAPENLGDRGLTQQPTAVNDARQVIGGSQKLDLDGGAVEYLGAPVEPVGFLFADLYDINEDGDATGLGVTACCSDTPWRVVRYTSGVGWDVIGGAGRYNSGYGINDYGDVSLQATMYCGASNSAGHAAGVYLVGVGQYCLNDLLDESDRSWWLTTTAGSDINTAGQIVSVARNTATGGVGAVRLTPVGPFPVPSAPANLTAEPHEPTWQQPWNAITLTWKKTGLLGLAYRIERSVSGQGVWEEVAVTKVLSHWDMGVELGVTYDYRVQAIGLAGYSEHSNTATATAPAAPADNTDPVVRITSPADGATVEGNVSVVVEASDNVGVTFLRVLLHSGYTTTTLCSFAPGGATTVTETCAWNTRNLEPGSYRLEAYAGDALNNGDTDLVTVAVGDSDPVMVSTSVDLSARTKRKQVTVTGKASIVDGSARAVRSAIVYAVWTFPDGSTRPVVGYTDRKGVVTFKESAGAGIYVLKVTNVVKAGYSFDASASVLEGTIEA